MADIPQAARLTVQARACQRCERCGTGLVGGGGEVHHRQSRRFGNHRPGNLVQLCPPCHKWAHAHPTAAEATGWVVWGNTLPLADPADTPLDHHIYGRVRLDDQGGYTLAS